ncbi:MAG: LD-carboxypeptidase [Solobacterium sp.]|nr:LD-carboxypeptidase [Solobacterium sp.]
MKKVKTIGIISLSSGILGEDFVQHEVKLGLERLEKLDIQVKFMEHACKGLKYISEHPEDRAEDLLDAFKDDSIDMILCAIGGEDTYRLLPYLFEHDELKNAVKEKIFLGFSDTTFNHLMLHKVGLNTFYGQAFLPDVCEIDGQMLPYTEKYFLELLETGTIREITPSEVWYEERSDYSAKAVGTKRIMHTNKGFELLQGSGVFQGKILGGCIDSLYDIFDTTRHADSVELCRKYNLFPNLEDWKGKILLLESSEEQPTPEKYRHMIEALKNTGIFDVIHGILVGKPMDEMYTKEYQEILVDVVNNPNLPIVWNLNVGHATPRAIVPFGVMARVDVEKQKISFKY